MTEEALFTEVGTHWQNGNRQINPHSVICILQVDVRHNG